MDQTPQPTRMASAHALLVLIPLALVPLHPALARWPWSLLWPLGVYAVVTLAVRPLRRSVSWLRAGRLDRETLSAAGLISLIAAGGLVGWHLLVRPDLTEVARQLPAAGASLWVAGVVFAVLNATLEEILCRGILQEALQQRYGERRGILLQGLVFGVLHANGIPSGVIGCLMAICYGVMLGWLRQKSGGLLACCLSHFVADATIFTLVASHP